MPKIYTNDFKQLCVNTIIEKQMSIQDAAAQFSVGKRSLITWLTLHKQDKLIAEKVTIDSEKLQQLRLENKRLSRENEDLNNQVKLYASLLYHAKVGVHPAQENGC